MLSVKVHLMKWWLAVVLCTNSISLKRNKNLQRLFFECGIFGVHVIKQLWKLGDLVEQLIAIYNIKLTSTTLTLTYNFKKIHVFNIAFILSAVFKPSSVSSLDLPSFSKKPASDFLKNSFGQAWHACLSKLWLTKQIRSRRGEVQIKVVNKIMDG